MIADADEVSRLRAVGAERVVTKDEFAAGRWTTRRDRGRVRLRRPRGRSACCSSPAGRRRSRRRRCCATGTWCPTSSPASSSSAAGRRGPADLRAAVPHRRHGGRAVLSVLGAADHVPADVRRRRVGAPAAAERSPTPWSCRPCWAASSTRSRRPGCALPTLRHLSYGGGRMPLELVERTLRDLPQVDLVNAYGLTETSSTIAMLTPDDHREAFASSDPVVRARLGSVGRPLPTLEVEVRGEDDVVRRGRREGRDLGARRAGGGRVRRAQSVLTDDGWFRTRDAGWFDDARLLVRRRAVGRRDRAGRREHLAGRDRGRCSWHTWTWPRPP